MPMGKAAVFVEPYHFEITELPTPTVEPGGILVKITSAGICGSDLHYWRGEIKPILTIGTDAGTASAIEALGAQHKNCNVDEIAIDEANKIVSTPAYMLGPSIAHVAKGIDKLVDAVIEML